MGLLTCNNQSKRCSWNLLAPRPANAHYEVRSQKEAQLSERSYITVQPLAYACRSVGRCACPSVLMQNATHCEARLRNSCVGICICGRMRGTHMNRLQGTWR